jgi:hypothetical protein
VRTARRRHAAAVRRTTFVDTRRAAGAPETSFVATTDVPIGPDSTLGAGIHAKSRAGRDTLLAALASLWRGVPRHDRRHTMRRARAPWPRLLAVLALGVTARAGAQAPRISIREGAMPNRSPCRLLVWTAWRSCRTPATARAPPMPRRRSRRTTW